MRKQSIDVQCPGCGGVIERIEGKTDRELQEWGEKHEKCHDNPHQSLIRGGKMNIDQMTIGQAIVVLENETRVAQVNNRPWAVKAFKLGIEALRRIKEARTRDGILHIYLLPGETE